MAKSIGKAYIQILPSAKGISGELSSQLSGEAKPAGEAGGLSLMSAMKGVLSVAALQKVGEGIWQAVNLGGELEQNIGGTEAVFGKFADKIKTTAYDAYKNMGMSASDYMATANKMAALFQGSGLEQSKAVDLTSEAMQRAADVASVMGLDTSAAMEAIAGAAKANFTMMDNLGVAMNATTLQAYALEKGVNFNWNTASNAQKAELAMKMFMERTKQYSGNFARESADTFSGSMGAVKSAWTNLVADLALTGGSRFGETSKGLFKSIGDFAKNTFKFIGNAGKGLLTQLPTIIENLAGGMQELFKGIPAQLSELLGSLLDNLPDMAEGILNTLMNLLEAGFGALIDTVGKLAETIPQKLPALISKIAAAIPRLITTFIQKCLSLDSKIAETGVKLISSLFSNLPAILGALVKGARFAITGIVNAFLKALPQIAKVGLQLVTAVARGFINGTGGFLRGVWGFIKDLFGLFLDTPRQMIEIGRNLVLGLWEGIKGMAGWLWDQVSGWVSGLWSGIKSFFGIHSPSTRMYWMGEMLLAGLGTGITDNVSVVSAAMDKVAAATDRELSPQLKSTIVTDHGALVGADLLGGYDEGSTGGKREYNITIKDATINDPRDVREISKQIAEELERCPT